MSTLAESIKPENGDTNQKSTTKNTTKSDSGNATGIQKMGELTDHLTVLILGGHHDSVGAPYVVLQELQRLHASGIPVVVASEKQSDKSLVEIYKIIKRDLGLKLDIIKLGDICIKHNGLPLEEQEKFLKETNYPDFFVEHWGNICFRLRSLHAKAKLNLETLKAQLALYHFIIEKNIPFHGLGFEDERHVKRSAALDRLDGTQGFLNWEPSFMQHMVSELHKARIKLPTNRGVILIENIGLYHAHRLAGTFTMELLKLGIPKENFTILPIEFIPSDKELASSPYVEEAERLDLKEYSEKVRSALYCKQDAIELQRYYEANPMQAWNWSFQGSSPVLGNNFCCPSFSNFTQQIINQRMVQLKGIFSEVLPQNRAQEIILNYLGFSTAESSDSSQNSSDLALSKRQGIF